MRFLKKKTNKKQCSCRLQNFCVGSQFFNILCLYLFYLELQQCPYWSRYGRPRLLIYTVINSKYFDLAIAGVIGLNVVTMAMEYYMMPVVSQNIFVLLFYSWLCKHDFALSLIKQKKKP